MKPRKPLVAGNWKMNGDLVSNERLFTGLRSALDGIAASAVDIVVCPPYPYIGQAAAWLGDTGIEFGAQDVAAFPNGAYTGEVSAAMLADLGCRWVIIGHSERRTLAGETDAIVADKLRMALEHEVAAIVCVGESLEEREAGRAEAVIGGQLDAVAAIIAGAGAERIVVAYEPVWAIGTGRTASPETAQEVHGFIRARLREKGVDTVDAIRILYGGSVRPSNAASLFAMPDIDGGLIGGASLVADDFMNICRGAAAV